MSLEKVEELLIKGGNDEEYRKKFDAARNKDEFIELAKADGFEFTVEELMSVLNDAGDSFESYGNPPKRSIWWKD